MKQRWFAAVLLAAFWLIVFLTLLQYASPVTSSPAPPADTVQGESARSVRAASALALDVVINEVAWSGTAASSSDEWIELYKQHHPSHHADGLAFGCQFQRA